MRYPTAQPLEALFITTTWIFVVTQLLNVKIITYVALYFLLQFSSEQNIPIRLDAFDNYQFPETSKKLKAEINKAIGELGFIGQGAYLDAGLFLHDMQHQFAKELSVTHVHLWRTTSFSLLPGNCNND